MPIRVQYQVDVDGVQKLDDLSTKTRNAAGSTAELDKSLQLTQERLKRYVSDGDISPKIAQQLSRAVASYKQFGVSAQDALLKIRKDSDQYGEDVAKLARRVEQSNQIIMRSYARTAQAAQATRATIADIPIVAYEPTNRGPIAGRITPRGTGSSARQFVNELNNLGSTQPVVQEVEKKIESAFQLRIASILQGLARGSQAFSLIAPSAYRAGRALNAGSFLLNRAGAGNINIGGGGGVGGIAGGALAAAGGGGGGAGAGTAGLAISGGTALAGLTVAGVTAISAATLLLANSAGKAAIEERNLGEQLGLSIQDVERLQGAARITGTSFESLSTAFNHYLTGVNNFTGKTNEVQRTLTDLNVSPRNADGGLKATKEQIIEISDAIRALPLEDRRDALDRLFGRGGRTLISFFDRDLREATDVVEKFGSVMGEATSDKAIKFREEVLRIEERVHGLKIELEGAAVAAVDFFAKIGQENAGNQSLENRSFQSLKPKPKPAEVSVDLPFFGKDSRFVVPGVNEEIDRFKQQRDSTTREGAEKALREAEDKKRNDEESLEKLRGRSGADIPTRVKTLESSIKSDDIAIESARKRVKVLSDYEAVTKRLQEEVNKSQEKELFGLDKIERARQDALHLLERGSPEYAKQVGLVNALAASETKRLQVTERQAALRRYINEASANVRGLGETERANRGNELALLKAQSKNNGTDDKGFLRKEFDVTRADADSQLLEARTQIQQERLALRDLQPNPQLRKDEESRLNLLELEAIRKRNIEVEHAATVQAEGLFAVEKKTTDEVQKRNKALAEEQNALGKEVSRIQERRVRDTLSRNIRSIKAGDSLPSQQIGLEFAAKNQAAQFDFDVTSKRAAEELQRAQALTIRPGNEEDAITRERAINAARIDGLHAAADFENSILNNRKDAEIALAQLRKQQLSQIKSGLESVLDAALTGKRGAVQSALTQIPLNLVRQIGGNIISSTVDRNNGFSLDKLIPGQTTTDRNGQRQLTNIGRALSGTVLGTDPRTLAPKVDPLKISFDQGNVLLNTNNQLLTVENQLLTELNGRLGGTVAPAVSTGGGTASAIGGALQLSGAGGLSGLAGIGSLFGGATSNPFIFNNQSQAGNASSIGIPTYNPQTGTYGRSNSGGTFDPGSLAPYNPSISSGTATSTRARNAFAGTVEAGLFASDASAAQRLGSGVATAGVLYGAYRGISTGLRQGGAYGTLGAIGAGAGAAAALDPEPISRAILGTVALVSKGVQAILGDPRARRERQLSRDIDSRTNTLPASRSYNSDIYGRATTRTDQGIISVNSVDTQYIDQAQFNFARRHGILEGVPLLPGTSPITNPVPGLTNPTAPPAYSINYNVNVPVQAIDGKSFQDYAPHIANALSKAIDDQHGKVIQKISAIARGA